MNCRLLTGTLYLYIRIVGYTFRPAGAKRVKIYVIYTPHAEYHKFILPRWAKGKSYTPIFAIWVSETNS